MRISVILLCSCLFLASKCNHNADVPSSAFDDGNDKELTVGFYNVENLFDTEDDPNTFDEEFTPEGKKDWDNEKYKDKLNKLSTVLSDLDQELPELIGLCEIENRKVLEDLIQTPGLAAGNYSILHRDSPDGRGIDCALLYRSDKVVLGESDFFTAKLPAGKRPDTRFVVYTQVLAPTDTLHVFVNHWPSRGGGQQETEPNRLTIAMLVRDRMDRIRQVNPDAKILLMGDFNDYPSDKSIRDVLQASGKGDWPMFNLMEKLDKEGYGTYNYKGDWGTLDQFIVSKSVIDSEKGISASRDAASIYTEEYILFTNADGSKTPSKTYGREYYGGYSDHLPIVCQLEYLD